MEHFNVSTDPNDLYYQDRLKVAKGLDKVEFAKVFEHRRAIINGVNIHYVIGGTGPVILFGHGWPASWYEWRHVLTELYTDFTCVAFDMPGIGDSEPPQYFDNKSIADLVCKFVENEIKVDSLFVVGHDVSGPGLITMAAYYPELVERLFLTETSIAGPEMGKVLAAHINEIWHFPVNASRLATTVAIGREEQFIGQFFSKWMYNVGALSQADLDEYVRTAKIPGVIECGASYYHKAIHEADEQGNPIPKDSLTMPVHYVGAALGFGGYLGGEDKAAFSTVERFATDISYEVLDKCSHWISEDRPVTIAKKIKEFFQQ